MAARLQVGTGARRTAVVLLFPALLASFILGSNPSPAAQPRSELLGIALEGYGYPFPVQFLPLSVAGHAVRLAYMDVRPSGPLNDRTVLLMHGRNFPASYWESTIRVLVNVGYRVIAPDQINFGKSSKLDDVPVSFDAMTAHTAA